MRSSPKDIEQKIARMESGWETIAPTKSFGGMTLSQFKEIIAPCRTARTRLGELEAQTTAAINTRDNADAAFLARAQLVVNGVLADPSEGPDSSLYEAMGYRRKSERKSGLRRGSRQSTGGSPPPAP
jgi:hypothetical protein